MGIFFFFDVDNLFIKIALLIVFEFEPKIFSFFIKVNYLKISKYCSISLINFIDL